MNENLQNTLNEIAKALQTAAEQAGGVAQEQLPLLVQEYLAWGMTKHSMGIILGALLVAVGFLFTLKAWRDDPDFYVGAVVLAFPGSMVICFNTYYFIQISVAPRVYLLEQIASMVK